MIRNIQACKENVDSVALFLKTTHQNQLPRLSFRNELPVPMMIKTRATEGCVRLVTLVAY